MRSRIESRFYISVHVVRVGVNLETQSKLPAVQPDNCYKICNRVKKCTCFLKQEYWNKNLWNSGIILTLLISLFHGSWLCWFVCAKPALTSFANQTDASAKPNINSVGALLANPSFTTYACWLHWLSTLVWNSSCVTTLVLAMLVWLLAVWNQHELSQRSQHTLPEFHTSRKNY